ncbi:MAG: glycosyltransferase family 39 protein [Chloroflexi bacterium]|nr:glycosyltransferase family 39 protein [Chloroflexota bacterium]
MRRPVAPRAQSASLVPLLAILVLAALLRFWQLGSAPILYFDSGAYLGEGRFLASAAQRASDAWFHPAPGAPANPLARVVQAVETGTEAHPPDLAKPGQAVLLALAILVFGPTTFAAGLIPALAGLGTVALTYAIGTTGWNRRVGVVAALLLAISAEHLVYSREPLVESTGLFFATFASLVYLRRLVESDRFGTAWTLTTVGSLLGLAFACNNRLLYLPVLIGAFELVVVWRDQPFQPWRTLVVHLLGLGAGFLAPLAVLEAAFLGLQALGAAFGATPGFLDYAHQFVNFTRMNPADRARIDQWPTFFVDLGLMDGLPVLIVVLIGAGVLLVRRTWSRANVLLAASLFVPVILFSVYSSGEVRMRNFSVALPWAMLVAAQGLCWIADRTRHPTLVATIGVCALGVFALPRDLSIVTAPSATPALLDTVQRDGITRVASTDGPVLSYYVGEERTNARLRPAFINTEDDLRDIASDYPYVEVDMQGYWTPGPVTERAGRATPVFQAPNGADILFLAFLLERHGMAWGDWNAVLDEWTANRAPATTMRLYRSADLLAS